MKNFKKVLALVLVVATLLSMATIASAKVTADYTDAAKVDEAYVEAIDVLSTMGVLGGNGKGAFNPKDTITREEAAKIIAIFADYDKAAGKYYAAANNFSDVAADNWAVSYIAYAAQTGIVSGVGGGKFNPKGTLTGVQFLKMALCTLGFDADAEGFKGADWMVNVLKYAKVMDLTAGIKNFDAAADLTREQAAQIMLNVLTSPVVTYAHKIGIGGIDRLEKEVIFGDIAYITETKAMAAGDYYYEEWAYNNDIEMLRSGDEFDGAEMKEKYDFDDVVDAFGRPGHAWMIDETPLTYADKPVYTFENKAMSGCDLAEAVGVKKTNMTTVLHFHLYEDGKACDDLDCYNRKHTKEKNCALTDYYYGHKGAKVEVYDMGKNNDGDRVFDVIVINTYFGKVTDVSTAKTNKTGHTVKTDYATIDGLAINQLSPADETGRAANGNFTDRTFETKDLVKGEYVLFTIANDVIQTAESVDKSITGKLTRIDYQVEDPYAIDIAVVAKAEEDVAFGVGAATTKLTDYNLDTLLNNSYVYYLDAYGNIIGIVDPAADTKNVVVMDYVYTTSVRGQLIWKADIVDFTGKMTEDVTISTINGKPIKEENMWKDATGYTGRYYGPIVDYIYVLTENTDGTYNIADVWGGTMAQSATTFLSTDKIMIKTGESEYKVLTRKEAAALESATWVVETVAEGENPGYYFSANTTAAGSKFFGYYLGRVDSSSAKVTYVYVYNFTTGAIEKFPVDENFTGWTKAYDDETAPFGWYQIKLNADGAIESANKEEAAKKFLTMEAYVEGQYVTADKNYYLADEYNTTVIEKIDNLKKFAEVDTDPEYFASCVAEAEKAMFVVLTDGEASDLFLIEDFIPAN